MAPQTLDEKDQVETFVKGARSLFEFKATNVEEIGNKGQEARQTVEKLAEIMDMRRRIDDKNRLLRSMAANAGPNSASQFVPVDVSEINGLWDAFIAQLYQYDAHLDQQKDQLKVCVCGWGWGWGCGWGVGGGGIVLGLGLRWSVCYFG